jgi:chorismate synthase
MVVFVFAKTAILMRMKPEGYDFGGGYSIYSIGESHGPIVTTIAGCPPGVPLSAEDFLPWLEAGRPGRNALVTPRNEADLPIILSGIRSDGLTDGRKSPIGILTESTDTHGREYQSGLIRPGHGNAAAMAKDGGLIPEGGGRLSVRPLRLAFVMGGVVAKKFLDSETDGQLSGIAWVDKVGGIQAQVDGTPTFEEVFSSPTACPDPEASERIEQLISELQEQRDSIGARVRFRFEGVPTGYGTPIFSKLQSVLFGALGNLNAVRSIGLGIGANAVEMRGSSYNDTPTDFSLEHGVRTTTNHAGGIQSGISMGPAMPIEGIIDFHATSSIGNALTITFQGEPTVLDRPDQKDDPCVGLRAPILGMSIVYATLAGAALEHRLDSLRK